MHQRQDQGEALTPGSSPLRFYVPSSLSSPLTLLSCDVPFPLSVMLTYHHLERSSEVSSWSQLEMCDSCQMPLRRPPPMGLAFAVFGFWGHWMKDHQTWRKEMFRKVSTESHRNFSTRKFGLWAQMGHLLIAWPWASGFPFWASVPSSQKICGWTTS